MSLTEQQLAERRTFLGGTDAAALAGVNPPGWAQPINVWLDKRPDLAGEQPPRRTGPLMGMGSLFEDDVAALFTAATGIRLQQRHGPVRSRHYPWMGGHLDRTTYGAIFEAKWQQSEKGFGPSQWAGPEVGWLPVPPVIPPHYMVQVQHYLIVTGKSVAFLGLLLGYAEFRAYRIPADYELHEQLVELERRFWHDNVLKGVPPEPDGSEAYGRVIALQQQRDRGTEQVATPEQAQQMALLQVARANERREHQVAEQAKQRLQLSMGSNSVLLGNGFSATYRSHEVRTVDWPAVAARLAARRRDPDAAVAEAVRRATKVSTQRPFRPKWDEDEEDQSGD